MNRGRQDLCLRAQAFLKSKFQVSSVPFDWIQGCVGCYHEIHSNEGNPQQLLDFVAQQWLLTDFNQLAIHSLPPNLLSVPLVMLKENYLLQVVHILDIGTSAYSQYTKIKKERNENAEVSADATITSKWEPKCGRMLSLKLTDGTQNVEAVEYIRVPQLNLDIVPGSKVLVRGPVECRRGVLLLQPNNLTLLGGEVEQLVNVNAPENVLARILNKPENPHPVYGTYTQQIADSITDDGDTEVIPVKQATMVQNQRSKVETCVRPQQPAMFSVNQAAKRSLPDSTSGVPAAKKLQGDDLFPDDDDDIFLQVPVDSLPPLTSRHQQTGANQQTVVENHQPTNNHRTIDKQSDDRRQLPATIQRPFVYLRTLNVKDDQIVCVKAYISTIRTKLDVVDGKWRLGAKINDGSAALDVDFSDQVLQQLIGFSPGALKAVKASGPDGARKVQQNLENCKQHLIRLNCILHLRLKANETASVIRLEEICESHLKMLGLI